MGGLLRRRERDAAGQYRRLPSLTDLLASAAAPPPLERSPPPGVCRRRFNLQFSRPWGGALPQQPAPRRSKRPHKRTPSKPSLRPAADVASPRSTCRAPHPARPTSPMRGRAWRPRGAAAQRRDAPNLSAVRAVRKAPTERLYRGPPAPRRPPHTVRRTRAHARPRSAGPAPTRRNRPVNLTRSSPARRTRSAPQPAAGRARAWRACSPARKPSESEPSPDGTVTRVLCGAARPAPDRTSDGTAPRTT